MIEIRLSNAIESQSNITVIFRFDWFSIAFDWDSIAFDWDSSSKFYPRFSNSSSTSPSAVKISAHGTITDDSHGSWSQSRSWKGFEPSQTTIKCSRTTIECSRTTIESIEYYPEFRDSIAFDNRISISRLRSIRFDRQFRSIEIVWTWTSTCNLPPFKLL